MKCLWSKGKGAIAIFGAAGTLPYDICCGTGELAENMIYDAAKGAKLKDYRIKSGETLTTFCAKRNVDSRTRSMQERGFFFREIYDRA